MGHSSVRLKVRRRKVANLAAKSRQFTVNNNCIPKQSESLYMVPWNTIVNKTTRFNTYVPPGKLYRILDKPNKYGLVYEEATFPAWKNEKHLQTKNLRKRARGIKPVIEHINDKILIVGAEKYDYKSEFPNYTVKKMNRTEYMEKLVQHKLAKWERKNPKPADMFKEDQARWEVMHLSVEERIRDFVVSMYDKLKLYARHTRNGKFTNETVVAELKDITGEGHNVNGLKTNSKLYKVAKKTITNAAKADKTVTAGRLVSHNKRTGRIILPELQKAA